MPERTKRAIQEDVYLASLPLYPESGIDNPRKGAVHLLKSYGIDAHRAATCPPWAYVPPQSWWSLQARDIIALALRDGDMLFYRHPRPFARLRALIDQSWRGGTSLSHGHDVPRELPRELAGTPAQNILFSALAIKLATFGMHQPIPFARHVLGLVAACYRAITHGAEQSWFADTALAAANDAWDYASDHLAHRIRTFSRERERTEHATKARARSKRIRAQKQKEEARHYYEQKLCLLRAKNASKLLWSRHNAAIAIQMWIRRCRLRKACSALRIRRLNLRTLCRGASARAKLIHRPIQSSKPNLPPPHEPAPTQPAPTPTCHHPFRHRGLQLPKRKRRQRCRRPRERPPRRFRRDRIDPPGRYDQRPDRLVHGPPTESPPSTSLSGGMVSSPHPIQTPGGSTSTPSGGYIIRPSSDGSTLQPPSSSPPSKPSGIFATKPPTGSPNLHASMVIGPSPPPTTQAPQSMPPPTQAPPSTPHATQAQPSPPQATQAQPSKPRTTQAPPSKPQPTNALANKPTHNQPHTPWPPPAPALLTKPQPPQAPPWTPSTPAIPVQPPPTNVQPPPTKALAKPTPYPTHWTPPTPTLKPANNPTTTITAHPTTLLVAPVVPSTNNGPWVQPDGSNHPYLRHDLTIDRDRYQTHISARIALAITLPLMPRNTAAVPTPSKPPASSSPPSVQPD